MGLQQDEEDVDEITTSDEFRPVFTGIARLN
jgi:hypothetical protein